MSTPGRRLEASLQVCDWSDFDALMEQIAAGIEDDKRKLTDMVKATMVSWHGRKVSPVYNLMPNLQEPDWKKLRIGDVREFWEKHDAWENRLP